MPSIKDFGVTGSIPVNPVNPVSPETPEAKAARLKAYADSLDPYQSKLVNEIRNRGIKIVRDDGSSITTGVPWWRERNPLVVYQHANGTYTYPTFHGWPEPDQSKTYSLSGLDNRLIPGDYINNYEQSHGLPLTNYGPSPEWNPETGQYTLGGNLINPQVPGGSSSNIQNPLANQQQTTPQITNPLSPTPNVPNAVQPQVNKSPAVNTANLTQAYQNQNQMAAPSVQLPQQFQQNFNATPSITPPTGTQGIKMPKFNPNAGVGTNWSDLFSVANNRFMR